MEREERRPAKRGITEAERREAQRAESYITHKVRGSLGIDYLFHPEDAPLPPSQCVEREDDGRER